jgi:hypothetical protein
MFLLKTCTRSENRNKQMKKYKRNCQCSDILQLKISLLKKNHLTRFRKKTNIYLLHT